MARYFWIVVFVIGASSIAIADETCNSPYVGNLIKGQEDYVYVWALGIEGLGDGSDKLVTVDVNPRSSSYGKVISSATYTSVTPVGSRRSAADAARAHVRRKSVRRRFTRG